MTNLPGEIDGKLAEQSVLGGMMLSKRAAFDVLEEGIEGSEFSYPAHEIIFDTIVALVHDGRPCDVISVSDELARTSELGQSNLARAGGAEYLHTLTALVPTAANAAYYADMVKRGAVKRRLVEAGTRIVQMGNASEGDAYELAENARAELDSTVLGKAVDVQPIGATIDAVVDALSDAPRFAPTPLEGLNGYINGLRPGALYVIGARPGEGKSIIGMMLAENAAHRGAVAVCSLEMDRADLTRRLLSMKGGVHMTALTKNQLTPLDWERIDHWRPKIGELPLFIDDRSGVTIAQIRSFVRSVARRRPLSAVVIDYLQLVRATDPRKPRWEAVGEITAALKVMARELDVAVVALCQLNRQSAQGALGRRPPSLSDLRESGSIEQDADVVLLMQRGYDEEDEAYTDEIDVIIAKNRHGSTGKITLLWEGQFARMTNLPY